MEWCVDTGNNKHKEDYLTIYMVIFFLWENIEVYHQTCNISLVFTKIIRHVGSSDTSDISDD